MIMKDKFSKLNSEELQKVSGGQSQPAPGEPEIYNGADANGGPDVPGGDKNGVTVRNRFTV